MQIDIYTYIRNTVRILFLSCLISSIASIALAQIALAQSKDGLSRETSRQIIEISETIKNNKSLRVKTEVSLDESLTEDMSVADKLRAYRIYLAESSGRTFNSDISKSLADYALIAERENSQRDQSYARIVELYYKIYQTGLKQNASKEMLAELRGFQSQDDWFVKHGALLYEAILQLNSGEMNLALENAQTAIKLIPNLSDQIALEASYETNGVISVIYLYSANLEFAAPATQEYIEQGLVLGRSTDGLALLNNIVYALHKWREPDLAETVAKTSLDLSNDSSTEKQVKALYRYGQTLNHLGKYSQGEQAINSGLELSKPGIWNLNLESQRAISLAGQGKIGEAKASLKTLSQALSTFPQYKDRFEDRIRETRALLAVQDADPRKVFEIMNERMSLQAQKLLRDSSNDTQKLMGTLANDKALQKAREDKLKLRAELAIERADAAAKRSLFLMFLSGLLAILVIGAVLLAITQKRIAKESKRLKFMAEAGERSKSQFLAVMSHELRTPLNGIIGLAEILSREGPTDDVRFKNGVILKSGLTLLDLLTNVLDMSKMETGKLNIALAPTHIRDIIQSLGELWTPKAVKKGVKFTLHVDPDVPSMISLDPMRTRQCLENLISNAIKFTADGRVHVHVTYEAGTKSAKDILKVIVADTGKGMSSAETESIFEPFTQADTSITRQFGGSGLGLAITRSLARLMGGDAKVISAPGRGSEFTLTLATRALSQQDLVEQRDLIEPLRPSTKEALIEAEQSFNSATQPAISPAHIDEIEARIDAVAAQASRPANVPPKPIETPVAEPKPLALEPAASAIAPSPFRSPIENIEMPLSSTRARGQSADPFRGLKILVVEDVASNQDVLKIFLEPVGCVVTSALNGHEALAAISQERFDVVLMDIRMPEMDGIEATMAIRANGGPQADVPIIALTADASAENNAQCMAAGADVFLTKPVVASELFGSIRFVLKQAERRIEQRQAAKSQMQA